jgi:hypothetical protein
MRSSWKRKLGRAEESADVIVWNLSEMVNRSELFILSQRVAPKISVLIRFLRLKIET